MIRRILLSTVTVLAGTALVASAAPKEEVTDAVKKLGEAKNYSWKSDVKSQAAAGGQGGQGRGRGGFGGGPTEGKVEKDGVIMLTMTRGENKTEAVVKGEKVAMKTQDGWRSGTEAGEAAPAAAGGRNVNPARMFQNYKAPAEQAKDLVSKTKELKKEEDAYTGELTEEGAKQLMSFGGRGGQGAQGGQGPQVENPKGTVKFWTKDGVLSKYEFNVQGKMSFNNNDIDINRTTTVEIKDVGSTKVDVPEEAKKKLEA
jgi:hypothetical protein